ncbi:MAG: zinc ribbon domain-containing protein [Clostridiales bacterium]|nr:zinc ribbon domain-containing protein [Clostridiales bacterium]HBM80857.1 zinc ribbon domain-containing protein [Clostridiaceae bacterium]
MALIDFECRKCGKKFFEIMSPHDVGRIKCPECGGEVKRVYKENYSGKHPDGCGGDCGSCSGCH